MDKNKKILIGIGISILIGILFLFGSEILAMDLSIQGLRKFVEQMPMASAVFVGLWIARLVLMIPGVTLTLLGGLMFTPTEAFTLSLIGLVLSDTLIYAVGRINIFSKFKENLKEKHEDIFALIEEYNYKFLALGVLCPVAPTDVICYLSSYFGLGYIKYIITFILANIPSLLLYSFLGESFGDSIYSTLFIVITLAIIGVMSLRIWNKLKTEYKPKVQ